jgi:hypothetical protein
MDFEINNFVRIRVRVTVKVRVRRERERKNGTGGEKERVNDKESIDTYADFNNSNIYTTDKRTWGQGQG